ncbi:N-acetyl-gamma-glutamyl-phosphate reductase [Leadbettera azotonutricia]|uniref:N-acetyl-gamma-glutamyl-phosphate reductase n=1 Tax=Leadbettera azotonutricia (strain ATCC BAA-888 / DSM 13862 / ZAS-9) TaxID=545695 RepID=F5Y8H3_LEAAZ|nr:N-acetyl-gamma-glutamyl-phosphate reductase [Leadbettera azotonutricia]AEF82325.1 N-acetyl-gamma-glutamyl-phosphate reductase [Leadbettera azotonutricia ZAS-9]
MTAGIIGATGYAGAELVRLLAAHPEVSGLALASVSFEGEMIENIYPNFFGKISAPLVKPEEVIARSDAVFAALPHGVGEPYAKACVEKGVDFIDLSADYRFDDDEDTFKAWYGKPYIHPELRQRSVYGLPELNREKILSLKKKGPVIIGNPGCYPTGASLGAFPALAKGLAALGSEALGPKAPCTIIVDSASGVTGGGREPQRSFHFPECSDAVAPYKVGSHRHTPEISRNFKAMAALGKAEPPLVIFTPHLAPMNRGILSTIYIPLVQAWQAPASAGAPRPPSKEIEAKASEIRSLYAGFYEDEPFVRVLPAGVNAATNRVRQSNFCDISVHLDPAGTTLIVCTAIDNMVKGAAGQAIQNMNVLMGFDETSGLAAVPALF